MTQAIKELAYEPDGICDKAQRSRLITFEKKTVSLTEQPPEPSR